MPYYTASARRGRRHTCPRGEIVSHANEVVPRNKTAPKIHQTSPSKILQLARYALAPDQEDRR
jgi:hypothetical protein